MALWSTATSELAQCLLADSSTQFCDAFHLPSIFDCAAHFDRQASWDQTENLIENHVRTSKFRLPPSLSFEVQQATEPTTAASDRDANASILGLMQQGQTAIDEPTLLRHLTQLLLVDTTALGPAAIELAPPSPTTSFAINRAVLLSRTLQELRDLAKDCRTSSSSVVLALSRYLQDTLMTAELRLINPCTLSGRSSTHCHRWSADNDVQTTTATSTGLLKAAMLEQSNVHSNLVELAALIAPFVKQQQAAAGSTSLASQSNALLSALYKHSLNQPVPSAFIRVAGPFFEALRHWLAHGTVTTTDFPIQPLPQRQPSTHVQAAHRTELLLLRLCGFHQTCDFPIFIQTSSTAVLLCGALRRICVDVETAFSVSLNLPAPALDLRCFQKPDAQDPTDCSSYAADGSSCTAPAASGQWSSPGLHLINDWMAQQRFYPSDLLKTIETDILAPIATDAAALDCEIMRALDCAVGARRVFASLYHYATSFQRASEPSAQASTSYFRVLSQLEALQSVSLDPSCRPFVYFLSPELVHSVDVFRQIYTQANETLANLREAWTHPDRLWVRRQQSPSASRCLVIIHRTAVFVQQLAQRLVETLLDVWREHIESGLRCSSFLRFLDAQSAAQTSLNASLAFVSTPRCVHLFSVYIPELLAAFHSDSAPPRCSLHLLLDGHASMPLFNSWFARSLSTNDEVI